MTPLRLLALLGLLAVGTAGAGEPAGKSDSPPAEGEEPTTQGPAGRVPDQPLPAPRLSDRPLRPATPAQSPSGDAPQDDCCDREH